MANVTIFGDFADRYDALVAYQEDNLGSWVESEDYSTSSMVLASTALAFMQFAQSFTDLGRLGNGLFVEGGIMGAGKDALRAISIFGTASAVFGRVGGVMFPRVIQEAKSAFCMQTAQANAFNLAGYRIWLTAEKLIKDTGGNVEHIWRFGSHEKEYMQLFQWMTRVGIPYRILRLTDQTFEALEKAIRAARQGVVTFGINATARASGFGKLASSEHLWHRLYATYSRTQGLRIFDPLGPTFRSFQELTAYFRDLRLLRNPIIHIPNSVLVTASHAAQRATEISTVVHQFAVHVLPVIHVPAANAETAAQVIALRDQPPSTTAAAAKSYSVSSGDTLSAIAAKHYGDASKWPLLYVANRGVVGPDPDLIKPGQQLILPSIPQVKKTQGSRDITVAPLR